MSEQWTLADEDGRWWLENQRDPKRPKYYDYRHFLLELAPIGGDEDARNEWSGFVGFLNDLESRLAVAVELAEALEGAAAATSVVRDFLYAGKVDRFAAEAATWAIHDAARKALVRWQEVNA